MAGRPKTRAIAAAVKASAREARAWHDEQKAILDERSDLTAEERSIAERQLQREHVERGLAAMSAARRKARRDFDTKHRDVDGR